MTASTDISHASDGTRAIIFGPMAALGGSFLLTWSVALANRFLGFATSSSILVFGAVAFSIAAAISAFIGIRYIRRVEQLSRSDSLTLLPNRRALHSDIQHEYRQGHEVALAMITHGLILG